MHVLCDDREVAVQEGATVLDALLDAGVPLAHSCRAGVCQSCLIQATAGTPPATAQAGLRPSLAAQGYFLACVARPAEPLALTTHAAEALSRPGRLLDVAPLSADVVSVRVEADVDDVRPGQYLTLAREDGLARSYSAAAVGARAVEFHVRVLVPGRMSPWLAQARPGTPLTLRGPAGDCVYTPGMPDQPLVLAGTGTGLAPLWGILQDALAAGHRGPTHLFHGARTPAGLYLVDALRALEDAHPQVTYVPCVLTGAEPRMSEGALDALLLGRIPSFKGHRAFLCGDPDLVQRLKKRIYLAGARLAEIHADPFIVAAAPTAA